MCPASLSWVRMPCHFHSHALSKNSSVLVCPVSLACATAVAQLVPWPANNGSVVGSRKSSAGGPSGAGPQSWSLRARFSKMCAATPEANTPGKR
eukprot:CAMPEP_0203893686 /NCGR_PEP_ID=MMETSP0359-20131031/36734_1 /ASSEMBLY_ACC=CAM_ASM_000338 /TAXON_ID=268821 /ORGANISM="Scrippsiella Hangoei, Strain SHTV-5" /LENGTH=93 /DNA_ID=CAMNT_0050815891 /DNA_START=452 /DNA_END=733 /DNA_ORIENTATION=+